MMIRTAAKAKIFCKSGMIILVLSLFASAAKTEIVPTGTGVDYTKIQTTLNGLGSGDTIVLKGDFVFNQTIFLPSGIVWILIGKLRLADNASLSKAGVNDSIVSSLRYTGITEKAGGASNITMSGGIYDGNDAGNTSSIRFINFTQVTGSSFHDFTVTRSSDDNFTLGAKSSGNICRNITSSFAGGNALTDKGNGNKWYDCIAEDCISDGWTPKCRNSEFYRCIARRNGGPGIGCFVRLDGANDVGEEIIGNRFVACESYDNKRAGISFNIAENSGTGAIVRNNFIQGKFYNNGRQGISFRNKLPGAIMENNVIDAVIFNNKSLNDDGTPIDNESGGGGFGLVGGGITGITGNVVSYENAVLDVNLITGTACTLAIYSPFNKPVSKYDPAGNSVTLKPVGCPSLPAYPWCAQTYLSNLCTHVVTSGNELPDKKIRNASPADFSHTARSPSGSIRFFSMNGKRLLPGSSGTGVSKGIVIAAVTLKNGVVITTSRFIR